MSYVKTKAGYVAIGDNRVKGIPSVGTCCLTSFPLTVKLIMRVISKVTLAHTSLVHDSSGIFTGLGSAVSDADTWMIGLFQQKLIHYSTDTCMIGLFQHKLIHYSTDTWMIGLFQHKLIHYSTNTFN